MVENTFEVFFRSDDSCALRDFACSTNMVYHMSLLKWSADVVCHMSLLTWSADVDLPDLMVRIVSEMYLRSTTESYFRF
jgi:hypothetical protein